MTKCPFLKTDCQKLCALWVDSEKMCSFRLLAADVADHRIRIRAAGMEPMDEEPKRSIPNSERREGEYTKFGIVYCDDELEAMRKKK